MQLSSAGYLLQTKIRYFKFSVINHTFNSFFQEHLASCNDNEFQQFIHYLKLENLDLLFFYFLKKDSSQLESNFIYNLLNQRYKVEKAVQYQHTLEIELLIKKISVRTIFLKGIILPALLELDMYKRSIDIDVLIPKGKLSVALKNLEEISYVKSPYYYAYGEQSLINPEKKINLDVHYDLSVSGGIMQVANIKSEVLFNNKQLIIVEGISIDTLDKELTFIHLCIHFAINHKFNGFMHLFELIRFIEVQNNLDWSKIIKVAKNFNIHLIVYLTLSLIIKIKKNDVVKLWETVITPFEKEQINNLILQHEMVENIFSNGLTDIDSPLKKLIVNNAGKKLKYMLGHIIFILKGSPMYWTGKLK